MVNTPASRSGHDPAAAMVTAIMAAVVGLTFLFGFGNVLSLALRLGVPGWVAPLIAPAVDLSILGLLLAIRQLVAQGAAPHEIKPARWLLIFASFVTLALNVAEPLVRGQWGKAAFDAVGPLLLIGWAEVGPGLWQALGGSSVEPQQRTSSLTERATSEEAERSASLTEDRLLERARQEDASHRDTHQRPISAETLRKRLRIGATRSRSLVERLRAERGSNGS